MRSPRGLPGVLLVLDRETGLVWERSPDLGTDTWSGAYGHCLVRVIGERRGWRLPAFEELLTLVVGPIGAAGLPPQHPFENIGAAYWTATTQLDNPLPTALIVGFEPFFFTAGGEKSNSRFQRVWCVRGGYGYDGR
jgi:Protein of unknown function (DUF1566)